MQELNRLKICTNFILKNSDRAEYFSDRFCIDSRRINNNQIFISLEPDVSKNITNIPIIPIGGIKFSNYKKLLLNKANFLAISGYIWNNKKYKPLDAIKRLK